MYEGIAAYNKVITAQFDKWKHVYMPSKLMNRYSIKNVRYEDDTQIQLNCQQVLVYGDRKGCYLNSFIE